MACTADEKVISGARASTDVLVFINVPLAMSDGIQFFTSTNGVILTRGLGGSGILSPKYFDSAYRRVDGVLTALPM